MALELRYGNWAFPLTPRISVAITPLFGHESPEAYREQWILEDDLFGTAFAGPTGIRDLRQLLESNVLNASQADLRLMDGTTVIKALWGTLSISGITISNVEYPPGDGSEYATNLPFRMTLYADFLKGQNYATGNSPSATSDNVFGRYVVEETVENQSRMLRISGEFHSASDVVALAAINALIDNFAVARLLLSRQVSQSFGILGTSVKRGKARVQFSATYLDRTKSPNIYDWSDNVSVSRRIAGVPIERVMLGGKEPVLQTGPITPTIVRQSGSAKGRLDYPPFPMPFALPMRRNDEDYGTPQLLPGGGHHAYPIAWNREYVVVGTTFTIPAPTPPPEVAGGGF